MSILRALWKRKLLIAGSWLAVALVSAAVVVSLPAVYQARTVILIERQRIPERYVTSTVNEDLANRLNRISQQILSYEPLLRMIEEFNLYKDDRGSLVQEEIVQKMRSSIRVSLVEGWAESNAPAFQIVFEGRDPSVVAQVTNRLATLFIDENLRARANQALGTTEFLTNQLEESRQQVERQEELMRDFRLAHNGALPEQATSLSSELARIERELVGIGGDIERIRQTKQLNENALASAQATLEVLARMAAEPGVRTSAGMSARPSSPANAMAVEAMRAEDELLALRGRYSDSHPDVVRARQRVERLREMAAQVEKELAAEPVPEAPADLGVAADRSGPLATSLIRERERIEMLQAQIRLADEQIRSAENRRRELAGRMAGVEQRLNRIPLNQQEMTKVARDYQISVENYRSLLDKRIEADLAAGMETMQKAEKFSVLESARLPEKPIRPDRLMLMTITLGAGLFASCLLGFGVELRRNVMLGEWEMPPGVVILGQVPEIRTDGDRDRDPGAAGGERAAGASRRGLPARRALIASSLILSLAAVAGAAGLYFGWIEF